ncbi:MAG: AmmeMemoRadiSam system protein B [Candidatus Peribacteraceae bacterium]|nr:AmmeMemoRadiSam system protein B [Candidatus Peribacteraceae bacterium]
MTLSSCGRAENVPEPERQKYQSDFECSAQYDGYFQHAESTDALGEQVKGVILPHHLLAGSHLAEAYAALREQHPSVVVIVSPDHDGAGEAKIVTTDIGYATPYGSLAVDQGLADQLSGIPLIRQDRNAFIYEAGISAHMPFIRHTFGDVPVLPVLVQGTTTMEEAEALARILDRILPDDALVVASVDFSHYVPEWVADFHDATSLSTLENFDLEFIPRLEVDSPASLATLQMFLKMRGAQRIVYRDHTNSASIEGKPEIAETTSHVYLAFSAGEPMQEAGISMLFYGDSMFARGIRQIGAKHGEAGMLDGIAQPNDRFFLGSHLTVVNQEGPVTDSTKEAAVRYVLKSDPVLAKSMLQRMKVNVLSFNNNHVYDAFDEGVADTQEFARTNGMTLLEPDEPCHTFNVQQKKVALCAFDDSRKAIAVHAAQKIVEDRKKSADWVVLSIHWGQEYHQAPSDREREIARLLIDAGADAIVGHGPHVVQPIEYYDGKPIAYSLGNFLFDQFDAPTNTGMILGLFLAEDSVQVTPIPFSNYFGKLSLLPFDSREELLTRIRPALGPAPASRSPSAGRP